MGLYLCTSTIKGEGKPLWRLTCLWPSQLEQKVLLIGADLRNPQVHNYVDLDKRVEGLSNFLHMKLLIGNRLCCNLSKNSLVTRCSLVEVYLPTPFNF